MPNYEGRFAHRMRPGSSLQRMRVQLEGPHRTDSEPCPETPSELPSQDLRGRETVPMPDVAPASGAAGPGEGTDG